MAKPSLKMLPAGCLAEFCAMTLFVIFGCGSAMGLDGNRTGTDSRLPGWVILVSLVFGLTITTLVYATAHISGGHINCAVTFGLVLTGNCSVIYALPYFISQMAGSIVGALILTLIYPAHLDSTKVMGANGLADGWNWFNAFAGEIAGTCLLMTAVLQVACHNASEANRSMAPLAIGLAVFVAHAILIPIDGCSINPTRSFGPAVVASFRNPEKSPFKDHWIFWAGPLIGSSLAAGFWYAQRAMSPKTLIKGEETGYINDDDANAVDQADV